MRLPKSAPQNSSRKPVSLVPAQRPTCRQTHSGGEV